MKARVLATGVRGESERRLVETSDGRQFTIDVPRLGVLHEGDEVTIEPDPEISWRARLVDINGRRVGRDGMYPRKDSR